MITRTDSEKSAYTNVWVVAEILEGIIQPVTHELIGSARALADERGSQVWVLVMGSGLGEESSTLFAYGADCVLEVDDPLLARFHDETEAKMTARLIEKYKPEIVLCGATTRGRALIPRVSVLTHCGLTADCTQLAIDPDNGELLQTRPAFGGNIMATIRSSDYRPQMATVRPRVMEAPQPDSSRTGQLIREPLEKEDLCGAKKVLEVFHSQVGTINLSDARIIVSGGRGLKGPEGFELIKKLAQGLGGAVGASRAAVDAGWIPYAHQVGQTGQTVQTEVYIACGISGQIQHLVGMQSCDLIIAIDKDSNTPMMQMADIALEGDLFEVIPAIIEEVTRL